MKKNTKGIMSLLLAAGLLAGCGSAAGSSRTSAAAVTAAPAAETAAASESSAAGSGAAESAETEASSSGAGSGKTLVVYYSATGNTKAAAEMIAGAAGADLFELTPVEPYTSEDLNWSDDNSRVVKEHEDEALQNQVALTTTSVDAWDSYDTVFIGYPIWWGIAAWPVNQFVQNNDFTGKKVIPFCTSSSSGLGESGKNLAEMAGTGDWQEGRRFSSHPDSADVTDWVSSQI